MNSVKTGIQKVEFKWSLFTQISPSWWLGIYWIQQFEFKSSYSPRFHPVDKWISIVEFKLSYSRVLKWIFELPVFTLTLWKLGLKISSLSRVYAPRFYPVGDWNSKVEFKWSFEVEFRTTSWHHPLFLGSKLLQNKVLNVGTFSNCRKILKS